LAELRDLGVEVKDVSAERSRADARRLVDSRHRSNRAGRRVQIQ
jgi:hypothetical protein